MPPPDGERDLRPRWLRWPLVALGLATMVGPGLALLFDSASRRTWIELYAEVRASPGDSWWQRSHHAALALDRHNERLTRESALSEVLRPRWQGLVARLGAGNETVYLGRGGFLELRDAVDAVTGPGFLEDPRPEADPRAALRHFAAELAKRGIALWLLPVPSKITILPEAFARGASAPLHDASFPAFVDQLRAEGIPVFDPTPLLLERARLGLPTYLATDSHWHPAAMAEVAEALARDLERALPLGPPARDWRRAARKLRGRGDLPRLLELEGDPLWPAEEVEIAPVSGTDGQLFAPEAGAEILLLGDSFTNVFAEENLGWGPSAGLAEQLAFALRRPLDRVAVNGGGALGSRERLAEQAAAGRDRLQGKKVVILQFAARELSIGRWPAPEANPGA